MSLGVTELEKSKDKSVPPNKELIFFPSVIVLINHNKARHLLKVDDGLVSLFARLCLVGRKDAARFIASHHREAIPRVSPVSRCCPHH